MESVPQGKRLRQLKALGKLLEPIVRVGKRGPTEEVVRALQQAFKTHELVKVKFSGFEDREEKRRWVKQLATASDAFLVMQIGNVAVFYKAKTRQDSVG